MLTAPIFALVVLALVALRFNSPSLHRQLARYGQRGCIDTRLASRRYVASTVDRYAARVSAHPIHFADSGDGTRVVLLTCDPDRILRSPLAEYEERSDTLIVDATRIDDALRGGGASDVFAKFVILHELGHRDQADRARHGAPESTSQRIQEETADAFSVHALIRGARPGEDVAIELMNLIEVSLETELTQNQRRSLFEISATHPPILTRALNIYAVAAEDERLPQGDRVLLRKEADAFEVFEYNLSHHHMATIELPPGHIPMSGVQCGDALWLLSDRNVLFKMPVLVFEATLVRSGPSAVPTVIRPLVERTLAKATVEAFGDQLVCRGGHLLAVTSDGSRSQCLSNCPDPADTFAGDRIELSYDEDNLGMSVFVVATKRLVHIRLPDVAPDALGYEVVRALASANGAIVETRKDDRYRLYLADLADVAKVRLLGKSDRPITLSTSDDGRYWLFVAGAQLSAVRTDTLSVKLLDQRMADSWPPMKRLSLANIAGFGVVAIDDTPDVVFLDQFVVETNVFLRSGVDLIAAIPASRFLLVMGPSALYHGY